jgi:hypothetical protein
VHADHAAHRIDQDQRGPRAHAVAPPDLEAAVVDDRVLDLVAGDRGANVAGVTLVVELGRMDADDYQLAGVLRFEPLEIGNDVHAVDATVSPEIEQDHFAVQLIERQRRGRVEPFETGRKIRRVHRAFELKTTHW